MAENNYDARRRADLKAVGGLYKKKFKWLKRCVYCGGNADTWDHVLPISRAAVIDFSHAGTKEKLGQGLKMVPCCKECNQLAGGQFFTLIRAKREYIRKKLHKKYQKKLRTVMWDEDEMKGVSYRMRQDIEKMLHNRIIIERRLAWPSVVEGHIIHSTKAHLFESKVQSPRHYEATGGVV